MTVTPLCNPGEVCALSVLRVSARDTAHFIAEAADTCQKEGDKHKRIMVIAAAHHANV